MPNSSQDSPPFLQQFYALECKLNVDLAGLSPPAEITHVYNPVEYAAQLHCQYLQRFLGGPKKLMFFGMNPGANGMAQNGVPFGNISTVRDIMQLSGEVSPPTQLHVKRPIKGLQCTVDEPSGKRLWTLLKRLSNDSLETFSQQCFVHNFCPLIFFDTKGQNIIPKNLKVPYKTQIRDKCLLASEGFLRLVQPDYILEFGEYVYEVLQRSAYCKNKRLILLPHPSPLSLSEAEWSKKTEMILKENNLIKYLRNEEVNADDDIDESVVKD